MAEKELGILALRGFSDMKEKARDLMVRNKSLGLNKVRPELPTRADVCKRTNRM